MSLLHPKSHAHHGVQAHAAHVAADHAVAHVVAHAAALAGAQDHAQNVEVVVVVVQRSLLSKVVVVVVVDHHAVDHHATVHAMEAAAVIAKRSTRINDHIYHGLFFLFRLTFFSFNTIVS